MIKGKLNLYLESSVISMYFQDNVPHLRDLTRQFWEEILPYFDGYVSEIVLAEVRATTELYLRKALETLISEFEVLKLIEDTIRLSDLYTSCRGLPRADALHLASASVGGMDFLVTWNLKRLYKGGTQVMIREINAQLRIPVPAIVTPKDFLREKVI
ncbi:MAG: PIN domain-containing protein [Theionarchaea archaeon]|nr:PIN domain-containing protein [Theionarchaea archaeon]